MFGHFGLLETSIDDDIFIGAGLNQFDVINSESSSVGFASALEFESILARNSIHNNFFTVDLVV